MEQTATDDVRIEDARRAGSDSRVFFESSVSISIGILKGPCRGDGDLGRKQT